MWNSLITITFTYNVNGEYRLVRLRSVWGGVSGCVLHSSVFWVEYPTKLDCRLNHTHYPYSKRFVGIREVGVSCTVLVSGSKLPPTYTAIQTTPTAPTPTESLRSVAVSEMSVSYTVLLSGTKLVLSVVTVIRNRILLKFCNRNRKRIWTQQRFLYTWNRRPGNRRSETINSK